MTLSWCAFVQKKDGEKLRQWLIGETLLNRNGKIQAEDKWLIFPLIRELMEEEKAYLEKTYESIQFKQHIVESKQKQKPPDLVNALENDIPKSLQEFIPKSFDIIGTLVILEIPDELDSYEDLIGKIILKIHPSITSIFKKLEPIQGDFRLRNMKLIAGINNTITTHKENKCRYELDVREVYFSPRLATEHARVCSLVKDNETILDMFAGIGPFSILIAKEKRAQIQAVDINPAAVYYLKKNIKLNKVENYVIPFEGNVRELFKGKYTLKFDRLIMNLPSKAFEFLDIASQLLKNNSIIHYYQFVTESDYPTKFLEDLKAKIQQVSRKVLEILQIRKVRPYAPYIWQIGVDLLIE
jgi:tRNA (guanine37-N1)-methyltransferase